MGDDFLAIYDTRAIVIKTQDYKESDKIVWLFSEKLGKISVVAKGAKKNRSKLFSNTLSFCYGNYVIYKGKGMYTLNEGEIIDSFQNLLGDLETITYASYFCELIDIAMIEEESNREIFKDFISSFYFMKNKVGDIETLARIFELKVLNASGYGLSLDKCCICRNKLSSSNYMSLQYLGGICNNCEKINGINVSNATYNIIKYLNNLPLEKSYRITIPTGLKDDIYKVLNSMISQNYCKKPKSLETLNFLKGS